MSTYITPATPGPTIETTEITDGAVTPPKLDRAYIERLNGQAEGTLSILGIDSHLSFPDQYFTTEYSGNYFWLKSLFGSQGMALTRDNGGCILIPDSSVFDFGSAIMLVSGPGGGVLPRLMLVDMENTSRRLEFRYSYPYSFISALASELSIQSEMGKITIESVGGTGIDNQVLIKGNDSAHKGILSIDYGWYEDKRISLFHDGTNAAIQTLAGNINLNPKSNNIIIQGNAATPATTYLRVIGQDATHYGEIRAEYGTDGTKLIQIYHNGTDAYILTSAGLLFLRPQGGKTVLQSPSLSYADTELIVQGYDETHWGRIFLKYGTTGSKCIEIYHNGSDGIFHSAAGSVALQSASNNILAQGAAPTPATTLLRVIGQDATHYGEIRAEYGTDGTKYITFYRDANNAVISTELEDILMLTPLNMRSQKPIRFYDGTNSYWGYLYSLSATLILGSTNEDVKINPGNSNTLIIQGIATTPATTFLRVIGQNDTNLSTFTVEYGTTGTKKIHMYHDGSNANFLVFTGNLNIRPASNAMIIQGNAGTPATTLLRVLGQDATHYGEIRAEYGTDGTKYISLYHDGTNGYIRLPNGELWISLHQKGLWVTQDDNAVDPTGIAVTGPSPTSTSALYLFAGNTKTNYLEIVYGDYGLLKTTVGDIRFEPNSGLLQLPLKTITLSTNTGTAGQICWDANYIYVCTALNTWKRAALSTW